MLAALKPKSIKYPKTLNTLGDHIRQKRLDLALLQSDVARLLNANEITIYNWENNRNVPQVHRIPKILAFLEYNPLPAGGIGLGETDRDAQNARPLPAGRGKAVRH